MIKFSRKEKTLLVLVISALVAALFYMADAKAAYYVSLAGFDVVLLAVIWKPQGRDAKGRFTDD